MAEQEEGWETVKSNREYWNPKVGESIEGKLVAISTGAFGESFTLLVQREGKEVEVGLPAHKMLQSTMKGVPLGNMVRITFKETHPPKKAGQSPTRIYDVLTKAPAQEEQVN